jgi:hypothetical protein
MADSAGGVPQFIHTNALSPWQADLHVFSAERPPIVLTCPTRQERERSTERGVFSLTTPLKPPMLAVTWAVAHLFR